MDLVWEWHGRIKDSSWVWGGGSSLDHGPVFYHGKTREGMLLVGIIKALFENKSEKTLDNELEIATGCGNCL